MSDDVQLIVNVREQNHQLLEAVAAATGDSKTDVINRAVVVYADVYAAGFRGRRFVVRDRDGARIEVYARRIAPLARRWWWFW